MHSESKLVIDEEQSDKANPDPDEFVPRHRFFVQQKATQKWRDTKKLDLILKA